MPEGLYPGDYLKDVGAALAARDGHKWHKAPEAEWLPPVRRFAIDAMMALVRAHLDFHGVHQQVFSSKRAPVEAGRIKDRQRAGLVKMLHVHVAMRDHCISQQKKTSTIQ